MYDQVKALKQLAANMNTWKEQGVKFAHAALRAGAAGFSVAVDVDKVLDSGLAFAAAQTRAALALGEGTAGQAAQLAVEHSSVAVGAAVGLGATLSESSRSKGVVASTTGVTAENVEVFSTAFIYGLLMVRALQVREVLQRALQHLAASEARLAQARPPAGLDAPHTDLRVAISALLDRIPMSQADPFFVNAAKSAESSNHDKMRIVARIVIGGLTDGAIALGTHGVSTMVNVGLKTTRLPTAGDAVADVLVRSPTTAKNYAVIAAFIELWSSAISDVMPKFLAIPRYAQCGYQEMLQPKWLQFLRSSERTIGRAAGETVIHEAMRKADVQPLPACAFLRGFSELMDAAMQDSAVMGWVAYERTADHCA